MNGLMTPKYLLTLTLLVSGCGNVSVSALCSGLREPAAEHASALVEDGGDLSVKTGQELLSKFDDGCAPFRYRL